MGFAFLNYLNSSLEPGISLVLGILGFQEKLEGADLVITGEGRMDAQTAMGKVPVGIAKMAKEKGCSVFNGLYMLLYQGAEAFYLWTGKKMPTEEIKAKYFD